MSEVTDIVWGGFYKNKHSMWNNNQSYGTSIPIHGEVDDIWMIDTRILEGSSFNYKTQKAIDIICDAFPDGDHSWTVRDALFKHYHQNAMKITSNDMLNTNFELICDLNEYRALDKSEDYKDYNKEDIVSNVRLYNEHGYSWDYGPIGVTILKKDAVKSFESIFKKYLDKAWEDWSSPIGVSNFYLSKVESALTDCQAAKIELDPRDLNKIEQLKYLKIRLEYMRKEIDQYLKDTRYVYEYAYTKDCNTYLKDIPTMCEYLSTKCYCQNEIYDVDGFYYQLFDPNTQIKIIAEGKLGIGVIGQSDDVSKPQILFFNYSEDDKTIVNAIRLDVTIDNIELVKRSVNEVTKGAKVDKYSEKVKDKDIDALIEGLESIDEY